MVMSSPAKIPKLGFGLSDNNNSLQQEQQFYSNYYDSPSKYEVIDCVESSQSTTTTGFGIIDADQLPTTPKRKRWPGLPLQNSILPSSPAPSSSPFMLRRFLAESPRPRSASDGVDDSSSPSKFDCTLTAFNASSWGATTVGAGGNGTIGIASPARPRNRFYDCLDDKVSNAEADGQENLANSAAAAGINFVPESPANSDTFSSVSCSKIKENLERTPTRTATATTSRFRNKFLVAMELGSEEIIEFLSPTNSQSQPRSQSRRRFFIPDSESKDDFCELPDRNANTNQTQSFIGTLNLTPKRRLLDPDSLEITVEDSPSKSEAELLSILDDKTKPNSKKKLSLANELKRTIAQHNFALKNWPNKLKADNETNGAVLLFVVKCFPLSSTHEKRGHSVLLALCIDLTAIAKQGQGQDQDQGDDPTSEYQQQQLSAAWTWKWTVFKYHGQAQFVPGTTLVKLYPPWQQIFLPKLNDNVTICTDFYQFVQPTSRSANIELDDFENLKTQLASNASMKAQIQDKVLNYVNSGLNQFSLLLLVPYTIRNTKTIQKQVVLMLNPRSIDLDVVVCQSWSLPSSSGSSSSSRIGILVKDSDCILAYVEFESSSSSFASPDFPLESLVENLIPGTFLSLQNLMRGEKVTPKIWLPLFSVIDIFGKKQSQKSDRFYYKLLLTPDSKWTVGPNLGIPFTPSDECPKKTVKELLGEMAKDSDDRRVATKGRIELISNQQHNLPDFYLHEVEDDDGRANSNSDSEAAKIKVKVMAGFGAKRILGIDTQEIVYFNFLRIFRGIATLDQFSSVRQ